MTTSATLDSSSVQLQAGEQAVIPLQIRNNGEIVEGYQIEVVGPPSEWTTVEPANVSLYPGSSTTATVSFHPPRNSTVPAGELKFGVIVTPTEHPDEAVVPEGVVEVLPFLDTTAELLPRTSQGRREGRHQVAVDNRGNVPVTTVLTATDSTGKVKFTVAPQALTVPAGQAAFARVKVRPAQRIWRGEPVTYPIAVEVAPQDSPSVVLDGTYVQQPTFPPWLGKALLALLALLLLLAALWFLILKPTVEAAAKDAVDPQVKEAAAQADEAKKGADQAEGASKDAGGASTEAAKSAGSASNSAKTAAKIVGGATPKAKFVTTPFAKRLESTPLGGQDETVTFTVPKKTVMQLSDLVMSNPQGDFGRVKVSLEDQVLFDMALENFRDIDYHFVTPIEGKADQQLKMAVDCRAPGQPPKQTVTPKRCDVGMYFGGENTKKQGG
jgi:hypothetical protein